MSAGYSGFCGFLLSDQELHEIHLSFFITFSGIIYSNHNNLRRIRLYIHWLYHWNDTNRSKVWFSAIKTFEKWSYHLLGLLFVLSTHSRNLIHIIIWLSCRIITIFIVILWSFILVHSPWKWHKSSSFITQKFTIVAFEGDESFPRPFNQ